MPNSTKQFIDIAKIQDGVVILKNGGLRRVILVDGLNFDLKSEEEQAAILYAYQSFINSLDFSIQINIHSRKLNIEGYLNNLRAREKEEQSDLLKTQINEYIKFVQSIVETNSVMIKNFFLVVPYDPVSLPSVGSPSAPDKSKIKGVVQTPQKEDGGISQANREKLDERTDQIVSGLRQIGLRAVPLEDDELLELYYNFHNPATIETQKDFAPDKDKSIDAVIAPKSLEVGASHLKIGDKFMRTLFVYDYPRFLSSGWFSPIINYPDLIDISIFIHPQDTGSVLKNLRAKAAQFESQIIDNQEKGIVRDPVLETAYQDVESLRDALQQAREKLFDVGVYVSIYADSLHDLNSLESQLTTIFDSKLLDLKSANYEQVSGWKSVVPTGEDKLSIHRPLNSSPVSSFFPFVSMDLTSDEGILYGVNRANNTFIIFDRFSLENANTVIFAKAGSGKSFAAKLEIIRSLMMGADFIVVDPENEYEKLAEAIGGTFFNISLNSGHHINPFDIPAIPPDEEPAEVLKSHIVNLTGLVRLMLGKITDEEGALLDQAIIETYASHDITPDKDFSQAQPPVLADLENVLRGISGGEGLGERLYRFTKGTYAGFTNEPTNISVENRLIVFSIRDLEDELRPVAMYIILNFVWNLIRANLKKRIMIIDEAWWMMKYPDSASFLFGLAKRARKYYLGLTTITQDVEDFLNSPYGKPIITNSSLQLLLKQAPATADLTAKAFNLTEAEKNYLLEAEVGTGLFVAGLKQAAIQIVASFFENNLITTNPEELTKSRNENVG